MMQPGVVRTIVGLSIWLLGLTAAILGKNYLRTKNKSAYSWIPLASYLLLSAIALVVAGFMYHHRALKPQGLERAAGEAPPPPAKPAPAAKPQPAATPPAAAGAPSSAPAGMPSSAPAGMPDWDTTAPTESTDFN